MSEWSDAMEFAARVVEQEERRHWDGDRKGHVGAQLIAQRMHVMQGVFLALAADDQGHRDAGICGDFGPAMTRLREPTVSPPPHCVLKVGHRGWHTDGDGQHWTQNGLA